MTKLLLSLLFLMCENVNAAPITIPSGEWTSGAERATTSSGAGASRVPPFTLSNPMCQTGFTIAMRYDQRNAAGAIIKSVWVRKCVRVPRIVYGRKV